MEYALWDEEIRTGAESEARPAEKTHRRASHSAKITAAFAAGAVLSALAALAIAATTTSLPLSSHNLGTSELFSAQLATAGAPPHKFAVDTVTPVSLQEARGTCWIFAAVAVLEASYAQQGRRHGWLPPDGYVKMSEQAFGVAVLDVCTKNGSRTCGMLVGDEVWKDGALMPLDTQGGEPFLLYYLLELREEGAMPDAVCPYTPDPGKDSRCPGFHKAAARNPLRFDVASMHTYYERLATKKALLRNRVLSFSTSLLTIRYLLPCTADTRDHFGCDPHDERTCLSCPLEPAFSGVSCCVAAERESNTMDGSFFRLPPVSHPEPVIEGGHAMALVGYSDTFRTRHGFTGGWILKNSWWDGLPPTPMWSHARGSHSIRHYLQTISADEEADICPNSFNPRSWWPCSTLAECRRPELSITATAQKKPLHLECIVA